MIIYWDDGFEVSVPDSWTEKQAQDFAKRVRAGEVNADAISEAELLAELQAIRNAVTADRVLVRDSQGNAIASRVRK